MISDNWFQHVQQRIDSSSITTQPWDHIIIDDFLPVDNAAEFYQTLKTIQQRQSDQVYDVAQNGRKLQFTQPNGDPALESLMSVFGSQQLATAIQHKFGLDRDLGPDSTFEGGGLTFSPPGTFLRYHGDFNFSSRAQKYRVVNAICYFNYNYQSSNGGHLHLIDPASNTVEAVAEPKFNRCVLFKTNKLTPHGVNRNAEDFTRISFNCYFYADQPLLEDEVDPHRTLWRD
jgi:Rps23 Pro-64 3,4-dihydroxylase Tpa1-like proline 4-hydroxylase